MTDEPDRQTILNEARAGQAENDELVHWLRQRAVVLRAALERTSHEVADLRRRVDDLTAPTEALDDED